MKIVIKATKIELDKKLKNFIEKEISSLEKFGKEIFNSKVSAWVEVAKETFHHQKGPFYYAECQMRLPGKSLRVETLKENLKSAIIDIKEKLEREIKEYKEKVISKSKRGAKIFKKDLKISPLARFYRKGRIRQEGI